MDETWKQLIQKCSERPRGWNILRLQHASVLEWVNLNLEELTSQNEALLENLNEEKKKSYKLEQELLKLESKHKKQLDDLYSVLKRCEDHWFDHVSQFLLKMQDSDPQARRMLLTGDCLQYQIKDLFTSAPYPRDSDVEDTPTSQEATSPPKQHEADPPKFEVGIPTNTPPSSQSQNGGEDQESPSDDNPTASPPNTLQDPTKSSDNEKDKRGKPFDYPPGTRVVYQLS